MINWHRLFGLFLMDYFTGSPYEVELKKDLSLKQQFLDVVILRKTHEGSIMELPDGLDNLSTCFKSRQRRLNLQEFKFLLWLRRNIVNATQLI